MEQIVVLIRVNFPSYCGSYDCPFGAGPIEQIESGIPRGITDLPVN